MYTIIVGNGSLKNYKPLKEEAKKADCIICADGGAKHLQKISLLPDILIGDFDSIGNALLEYYTEQKVHIIRYPKNKDFTDTELAIQVALEKGAKQISFFAVMGNRLDHSLSSLYLLKPLIEKNIFAKISNDTSEVFLTKDMIEIEKGDYTILSLLALSEKVTGIQTEGLAYPLKGETLLQGSSLGISNVFTQKKAGISIQSGLLIIIKTKEEVDEI